MDCGYFADICGPGCQTQRFIAPGINRTIVVLNESALLGLSAGELQIGDDVIILQPTSKTNAYGVVKFVAPQLTGWAAFAVIGNGAFSGGGGNNYVAAPSTFTDFSMFAGGIAPSSGLWFASTPGQLWHYAGGDTQWRYDQSISA